MNSGSDEKRIIFKNFALTFLSLIALFIGLVLVSLYFEEELQNATKWAHDTFGIWGLISAVVPAYSAIVLADTKSI